MSSIAYRGLSSRIPNGACNGVRSSYRSSFEQVQGCRKEDLGYTFLMHADHKDDDRRITYFATTHTRGKREMFGIRAADRGKHIYVIGKTGMGKSTMLENMAIQDIQNGEGISFIAPHGSTAEPLLGFSRQY